MTGNEDIFERRQHPRYKVAGGVFVALKPRNLSTKLGSLIDISLGGLAFQYYIYNDINHRPFSAIDIHISGDGIFLEKIPVHMISNVIIPVKDFFNSTSIKRIGVQFGALSAEHVSRLKQFIRKHTIMELPDHRIHKNRLLV
jgi:hypothetical protein